MQRILFTDENKKVLYECELEGGSIIPAIGDTVWLPGKSDGLQVTSRHIAYDNDGVSDPILILVGNGFSACPVRSRRFIAPIRR